MINREIIKVFNFNDSEVRITEKDGEAWFVAKDVCDILGISNVSDAVSRLDNDESTTIVKTDSVKTPAKILIISESGMYSIVFRSNKSEAKAFSKWARSKVLPSIRKTGSYNANTLNPMEIALQSCQAIIALEQAQLQQESRIKKLESAKSHIDRIFHFGEYTSIRAYCNVHDIRLYPKQFASLGRQCTTHCQQKGIRIRKLPCPVYGKVNSYPADVISINLEGI